ncbi:MAG: hypothetical protein LBR50_01190 [Tannerella sp.]|jgi:hypothetical protein|nr:hypothetical protein [Tannerella sp.]
MKQYEQVIEVMKRNGGYATLGFLNQNVDVSGWGTKTPFATIRRIVQKEPYFFRIKAGLWALKDFEKLILEKFEIQDKTNKDKQDEFTHAYYQGLLLEIGKMKKYTTYFHSQNKNQLFLDKPLKDISSCQIFEFSYPEIVHRAETVDVIWFNSRKLPYAFFEVEHSTNIEHSLGKFVELQDFYSKFYIVADKVREREYYANLNKRMFVELLKNQRVEFKDYETISVLHTKTSELLAVGEL